RYPSHSNPSPVDEHSFTKGRKHALSHDAGFSRSNFSSIQLNHRNHFRTGAGQKTLVRTSNIVARHVAFADRNVQLARQIEDRSAGHTFKRALGCSGSDQLTFPNCKNASRGAFGDVTLIV